MKNELWISSSSSWKSPNYLVSVRPLELSRTCSIMVCTGIASLSIFLLFCPSVSNPVFTLNLVLVEFSTFPLTSLMQSSLSSFSGPSQRGILIGLHLTVGFDFSSLWSAFITLSVDMYGMFVPAWYLMSTLCFCLLAYSCGRKNRESN